MCIILGNAYALYIAVLVSPTRTNNVCRRALASASTASIVLPGFHGRHSSIPLSWGRSGGKSVIYGTCDGCVKVWDVVAQQERD